MNVAVIGATGLVGRKMLNILEERMFPFTDLTLVASEKSVGNKILCRGKEYEVSSMEEALGRNPEIALFSAGGETSKRWAPEFAKKGTYVVDNSSAWRMDPDKKLIVPEINAGLLNKDDRIIANPNCSTIQLVMVLAPLHREYRIQRVILSTYQSVTGSGKRAVDQMENERLGKKGTSFYPHPIDKNMIPHCDVFQDWGYTKEEWKMVNETKKILADHTLKISATAVRIPVVGGHGESVNVEMEKAFTMEGVYELLLQTEGITVVDDPHTDQYPMALTAHEKDDVFVGRIRRDFTVKNGLNLWIVSDNLRKGAATNAIQIAEYIEKNIL